VVATGKVRKRKRNRKRGEECSKYPVDVSVEAQQQLEHRIRITRDVKISESLAATLRAT
jgi:hypothetical protein